MAKQFAFLSAVPPGTRSAEGDDPRDCSQASVTNNLKPLEFSDQGSTHSKTLTGPGNPTIQSKGGTMLSFTSGIALGLDSFLAGTIIGMRSLTGRERVYLAFAFGAWDGLGSLLGSLPPHRSLELLTVVTYISCAFLSFRVAPHSRWPLHSVPVLLSLDNLLAGTPSMPAPAVGLSSASLALIGLCLGEVCRRLVSATQAQKHDSSPVVRSAG
jgi:hypothetical protein